MQSSRNAHLSPVGLERWRLEFQGAYVGLVRISPSYLDAKLAFGPKLGTSDPCALDLEPQRCGA